MDGDIRVNEDSTIRAALPLILSVLCTAGLSAQSWELDVRRVVIDHDPPPQVADTGEQIPSGVGLAARYVFPNRHLFVEAEWSNGAERRLGAICGGFFLPSDCVAETVQYSGGVFLVSAGWLARLSLGPRVRLGIRPKVGVGLLRANERGIDTGGTYSEGRFTTMVGVAAEAAFRPFTRGPWVSTSVGTDSLRPYSAGCEDCRQLLRRRLPQFTVGVGLAWSMRR